MNKSYNRNPSGASFLCSHVRIQSTCICRIASASSTNFVCLRHSSANCRMNSSSIILALNEFMKRMAITQSSGSISSLCSSRKVAASSY
ncbi:unnamed protein product [Haemonchus placei]|uniref:Uncharacterized protein n=1 Tax=Haemonchus placei TaxID=6290 RepID=A0A3P7SNR7_HAEPC|nr:unnamed protein product [Haemonchus placei]